MNTRRGVELVAVAAMIALAALYLASIGPYWNISPDSATYVGTARSLVEGSGARFGSEPPVTSLVYAAMLLFRPDGYLWLNGLTKVLILASLVLAFVLLSRRGDRTQTMLAVLFSLASTRLYYASTQLLSEPSYLLFSTAALLLLTPPARSAGTTGESTNGGALRPADWAAGPLVVITALTRTIGLTLPVAILLLEARALIGRRRKPRWVLIGFASLALAAVVAWEIRASGRSYIGGWFRMFFVDDPWSPGESGGDPSLVRLVEHVRQNVGLLPAVGGMLLNAWSPGSEGLAFLLKSGATAVFGLGLWVSLRREVSLTPLYVLLYVAVVAAHMLGGGGGEYRFLLPVLPFLFYYGFEGARHFAGWLAKAVSERRSGPLLAAAAALYAVWFIALGTGAAARGVRDAHSSPFGSYPIKRPENYDTQRIALWLRDHSQPQDRYASIQRDMFDVLTERRGEDLVPGRTSPADRFLDWLEAEQIRYLLVDQRLPGVRDSLLAIIRAHPGRFDPVLELPRASLYRMRPPE